MFCKSHVCLLSIHYLLQKTPNWINFDTIELLNHFKICFSFWLFLFFVFCFFYHFLLLYGLQDNKTYLKLDTIKNPGICLNCVFLFLNGCHFHHLLVLPGSKASKSFTFYQDWQLTLCPSIILLEEFPGGECLAALSLI